MNTNANMNINHKAHLNTNTIIIAKRHNKNYKTIIIPISILVDSLQEKTYIMKKISSFYHLEMKICVKCKIGFH